MNNMNMGPGSGNQHMNMGGSGPNWFGLTFGLVAFVLLAGCAIWAIFGAPKLRPPKLRSKRTIAAFSVLAITSCTALTVGATGGAGAAAPNLVQNPSVETQSGGFPSCFEQSGWGTNTAKYSVTTVNPHTGTHAVQVGETAYTSGDQKVMMAENTCAPTVIPGHTYNLSAWYKSNTTASSMTVFIKNASGWNYWTDLKTPPKSPTWSQLTATTPAVPAGTTQLTFGLSLFGVGNLVTDDYSVVDNTPVTTPPPAGCSGTATQCAQGQWTVQSFPNHVRAIHTVVLSNGKILFMAGSGNDPMAFAAGTFTSSLWDPRTNAWTDIRTPSDVFCSGHVQLPNGNVLILGGTSAYPAADGSHTYEGLKSSYIFNITTNTYQRVNDLNTGHWYPSATELGNGNVLSMGGLDENGEGTVTNEEFNTATGAWLPINSVPQQWNYFGLYPANILTANGQLFYSGSHVFGSQGPGLPGADIIDLNANTITAVTGLQDAQERDQSAAVLLPPAQSQKVMVLGGGNVDTNVNANRFTDLIDLSAASPSYKPGPLLPQGTTEQGNTANMQMTDPGVVPETGTMGKMYVSAVLLPDRTVLETGGALNNRANPVYEASDYNPVTNAFTPMAVDPVERGYHSESVLYTDGTVISVGSNPGDGSFDMRISIYRPPYLYRTDKPVINSVGSTTWGYGKSQAITTSEVISSAELIKPAAVTHSSDPNQRLIDLPITKTAAGYNVALTANDNIAPPGWYWLFVQNASGTPSTGTWVHVG